MEAPGDGEDGWQYMQENYHWSYYNEDGIVHKGWLKYNGEWYWFDDNGWMFSGGNTVIDGNSYYFFINGNMAYNQYVGMKYYDGNGQQQSKHDVRVIGNTVPDSSWLRFICTALVIGIIPGSTGTVIPASRIRYKKL